MSRITNIVLSWCLAGAMLMPGLLTPEIQAQRISKESKSSRNYKDAQKARETVKLTQRKGDFGKDNKRRPNKGNHNRPNYGNHNRPNNDNHNRPNYNNHNRPGKGNHNRPGFNRPGYRPGGNSHHRPGAGGDFSPRPKYRPVHGRPHSHFGHWRPLPPPPPRPAVVYAPTYVAPTISNVLGLAFGSLIEYGINSLINSGYNVSGYQNDAIFLNDISMMGYRWPQATVYYGNGGMNGALFQYRGSSWHSSPYDKVFRKLCKSYGQPVETSTDGAYRSATWWGGNDGYITLTAEGGYDNAGAPYCDTNLIYGR